MSFWELLTESFFLATSALGIAAWFFDRKASHRVMRRIRLSAVLAFAGFLVLSVLTLLAHLGLTPGIQGLASRLGYVAFLLIFSLFFAGSVIPNR